MSRSPTHVALVTVMVVLVSVFPSGVQATDPDAAFPVEPAAGLELVELPYKLRRVAPQFTLLAVPQHDGASTASVMALGERPIASRSPDAQDIAGFRAEAWTSPDGRRWKRSHRLALSSEFEDGVPGDDGSILALGARREEPRVWRLEPGGGVSEPERVQLPLPYRSHDMSIAGDSALGIVVVLSSLVRTENGLDALSRLPGGDWQAVALPRSADVVPVAAATTRSGFVVIGDDSDGLLAWRSVDGVTWEDPERVRDSLDEAFEASRESWQYLATDLVYDERQDLLLMLGYPDRAWLSTAGGPFEMVGPLAVPLPAVPSPDTRSPHIGVALPDGFLVVTDLEQAGMRVQTSPDGHIWTAGREPPLYARSHIHSLVVAGDRTIALGSMGDRGRSVAFVGPGSIGDYEP